MKSTMTQSYSVSEINKDFRIKVYGINSEGSRINKLVGVSGLIELIGEEMMNKFLERAYRLVDDKTECKLRRGLKVTFYNK